MGAVTFSLDSRLVTALQSSLPLRELVETGTFKGDTIAGLQTYFDKIVSIELSQALYADALKRFEAYPHVQILQGNSQDQLSKLRENIQNIGVLYWLDAHWCVATDTVGKFSQCPLLEELQAIGKLNSESVVLIDDARLFLAPPLAPHEISQWPSFNQIVGSLFSMSSGHELMVVNDVIAFYPVSGKSAMASYAQNCGIDWLIAANFLKENFDLLKQLEEKEVVINELACTLRVEHHAILQQLEEKEIVIGELTRAIEGYRLAFWSLRPVIPAFRVLIRIARRSVSIFRPRLGNLNQYSPRPLQTVFSGTSTKHLITTPKFSIITPSFQQGEYIERTLLSVLNQGYPNLEYFVQDGESKDCTVTVLQKYQSRLSGWVSENDAGQSQAINKAFAKTQGEIMAWLNSDDLLLPDTLTTVADFFNRHPDVDVVYGNRLLIDENDMEIGRWILPGHDSKVLSWVDYVPQETMFWRRRIWDEVGGHIDEGFKFAMDWDLLVRFRDAGAKFAHIPRFLGAFRIHSHQKTLTVIHHIGYQEMDRIRLRLLGRVPGRKEIRKATFSFLLKHLVVDIVYRIQTRLRGK